MTRPIGPMFFIGVFLLIVIAAVLMLSAVISRDRPDDGEQSAPRQAVARQLQLVKYGDGKALRETFTARVRDQVTDERVRAAKGALAESTLEQLVKDVSVSEVDGVRTAEVLRPDGSLLTRLVDVDGKWLADVVWFP